MSPTLLLYYQMDPNSLKNLFMKTFILAFRNTPYNPFPIILSPFVLGGLKIFYETILNMCLFTGEVVYSL